MAKKHKQQGAAFPLPVIVLGAVLLIAAVLIMVFQNRGTPGGTPVLAVEPQSIDYGEVKLDTSLTFEIKVTNTGDGTLRFQEQPYIEILEGC
jgi:hypothetical protein